MVALGRVGIAALCALPGALTLYFAFNGGGFFPAQPAIVAMFLALVLVVWTTLAEHPYAGMSPLLGLATGALALYALWTLVSGSWSHAPGRALVEFDRALLYVLTLVLFGSLATSSRRLRWMVRGIAVAIVVVCVFGLTTWLFPDSFHVAPTVGRSRLSFPVSYWNTLGLLAAMGIVLCLHLTCSRAEAWVTRVMAAAAIPLLATTLYFTFSRGAIAAAIVAVVAYCLLKRSRGLVTGLIAGVPPTVVVILFAYHADRLNTGDPTTSAAAQQGHDLAAVVAICVVVAGVLRLTLGGFERSLYRYELPTQLRRAAVIGLVALAIGAVGVGLAAHVPDSLASQYNRFLHGTAGNAGDLRSRLLDPGNNARTVQWKVALRAFRADRFHGQGAGTYQLYWERHRPAPSAVRDAHSLYLEALGELGVVGVALLAVALLAMLVGTLWRARSRNRSLYAVVAAVFLVWALRAAADWDWEMPVVTFVAVALSAGALAARTRGRDSGPKPIPDGLRMGIAVGWLAVAVAPALVTISDGQIARAAGALDHGDCRTARSAAFDSISALGDRAQPYEIVGYCDLGAGFPASAVGAMRAAVHRDPANWQYRDGLAVALAASGRDPRPEARAALVLDPLDDLPRQIERLFRNSRRDRWRAAGGTARGWMLDSGKIGAR